ncbi:MAG: hypothetical protein ACOYNI_01355 [Acidimicrobiia bacterium]
MNAKRWIAGGVLALTSVVGVAGVAAAAEGGATAAQPGAAEAAPAGPSKALRRAAALKMRRAAVKIVAEVTQTSPADVKAALQGGQSVADYAAAHGSSPEAVKSALVDAGNARIDRAVQAGRITQEQGDQLKARLAARIDQVVTRTRTARQG